MKVKLIRTILFRDPNGNDLRLTLGKIEDMEAYRRFMGFASNDDKGFRWQFVGNHIPMPVRSYEWFNGFPEEIMVTWVQSHGYEVVANTSHLTGFVYVARETTPIAVNPDDAHKGNEVPATTGHNSINETNCRAFHNIIRELCEAGRKIEAIRLYRYAHGGSLGEAHMAVNEIRDNID